MTNNDKFGIKKDIFYPSKEKGFWGFKYKSGGYICFVYADVQWDINNFDYYVVRRYENWPSNKPRHDVVYPSVAQMRGEYIKYLQHKLGFEIEGYE